MSELILWSKFVMNVILGLSKVDAQFAAVQEFLTLTIAKNAFKWKKTEMAVQKQLIQVVQKQICGTNGKNMALNKNEKNDLIKNLSLKNT